MSDQEQILIAEYICVGHPSSININTAENYNDIVEGCGFEFLDHPNMVSCPNCGSFYVKWKNYKEFVNKSYNTENECEDYKISNAVGEREQG